MRQTIKFLFSRIAGLICTSVILSIPLIPPLILAQETFSDEQNHYARVHAARERRQNQIDSLFKQFDITYPPHEIMIVVFKDEKYIELWARQENLDALTLVKKYNFTAFSGKLGPKRQQGDLQIPEGIYHITDFNPVSNFHLSLKINYPNESDRILGERDNLGGEIYIHGSEVTIGCIPIGNDGIEELYLICVDVTSSSLKNIPVYIFPARIDSFGMIRLKEIAEADTALFSFWKNLKQGYDIFYTAYQKLKFQIDAHGKYVFWDQPPHPNITYPWSTQYNARNSIINRISVPEGYARIPILNSSFGAWLRNLPLKEDSPLIYLYNGQPKVYQGGNYAVVDIDVGPNDLQQCADAVIRLYAEYLYSQKKFDDITFRLTNGDIVKFRKWLAGYRPQVLDNRIIWRHTTELDSSYDAFREYLNFVFMYAGTYSLNKQLKYVSGIKKMAIGNIFIQGGFPGHAVLITDMAIDTITGEKIFLLCQSYMPAQDIHILKNLEDSLLTPWYKLGFGETLHTPEWIFTTQDLKKF